MKQEACKILFCYFVICLLPDVLHDRAYYEAKYPKRNLEAGAMVTRLAPSPTGFVHIGSLYQAIAAQKLAHQSGGVCFLRIEDTDQKREVENGIEGIINSLKQYEVSFDEGPLDNGMDVGNYGPYIQSKRKDIYQAFVKDLIIKDLAYPSFLTEEEKEAITEKQKKIKSRIGYFGPWAMDERNMSMEMAVQKVKAGLPYVIRLKSKGNFLKRVVIKDAIKGDISIPENDMDIVLLKQDGIPTYHFAHAVDDTLMHTTHVTRGDEWISSLPIHVELFEALGFKVPTYAHLATIQKEEDGKKRKISKRKDPEANVMYYLEKGIPVKAVELYLMTLLNSNFEEWYLANPKGNIQDFTLLFDKMSVGGALFDMEKLLNISKNHLSLLTAEEVYQNTLDWAKKYDSDFANLLEKEREVAILTLNIERESEKPRKDFAMYSEVKENIWYMFKENFTENLKYDWQKITDKTEIKHILDIYLAKYYDPKDDNEEWFNKVKLLCDELGYASNMKEYKQNPEKFIGNVADVSTVIRVALTTSSRTPNLKDIMAILGMQEIQRRVGVL